MKEKRYKAEEIPVEVGFIDSSPLLSQPEALRQRADEQSYLFFKNLLPKNLILELRRRFLEKLEPLGIRKEDTYPMDGVVDLEKTDQMDRFVATTMPKETYLNILKEELFHELAHHGKLLQLYETLFDSTPLPHPRHIARVLIPGQKVSPTPMHQDYIQVQGSAEVWTCWIPLGDVPRKLGGLTILRGSHKDGVLEVTGASGAGGLEAIICESPHTWVEDDYEAGDVITFHSLTIHKALPNKMRNVIRLSCDYRYQSVDQPIEEKSLKPHLQIAEWDEIYKGWSNREIQYYWKDYDLKLTPWDESLRWQKERICD